jgi:hypothetical protein
MKNLLGEISRKSSPQGPIASGGRHPSECGQSNGVGIAEIYALNPEIMSEQVWQESPMNE